MALGGDEEAIGIFGIDDDVGDLLGVAQAEMLPGVAGVGGLVNAVAGGEIGTAQAFAAADVNDVGIGGRDGDGADGAGGLGVEDRDPGVAEVGGLPDSAVVGRHVENILMSGNAGDGRRCGRRGRDRSCASGDPDTWTGQRAGRKARWEKARQRAWRAESGGSVCSQLVL